MQNSFSKKSLLTKRILPIALVLVLLASIAAVAFSTLGAGAAGVAQNETVYFNLSKNSSWYTNGNGTLYARFFNGGVPVGNVVCTMQGTNIYKATAPAAADTVQLAVYNADTKKALVLNNAGTNRVFYDNASNNWTQPYVYNWKDANSNDGAWPGKAMTNLSGTMYYYDITKGSAYKYVIFSNKGGYQTADLTVPDDLAYWNGSAWVDVFSKSTSKLNLSDKASSANEIYLEGSNLVLSKYQYPNHNNLTTREVYVYNPNWTGNQIYVQYDLSDPYQGFFTMSKVTSINGKAVPTGYFKGRVPVDAEFKFFASTAGVGGSNQTTCSSDPNLNCYKMGAGAERWVKVADAQQITADMFADKKTTGENNADAFWVDATYYDYLSDTELTNGWLKPSKVGTKYNASEYLTPDDWYPFKRFNGELINARTINVKYPLYFGNFCNSEGAYPIMNGGLYNRNGGYAREILKYHDFSYIANNSNGLPTYNYSVQNLAANALSSTGDIMFNNSTVKMPYFQQSTADAGYAKSVQSYFPFRSETNSTTGVTRYYFNSKDATDNVFFKWSNGQPASVNYGRGTGYGVKDGLADFNYPDYQAGQRRGYGIFPFNNNSSHLEGNPGNGNLNYGFGVRMDMNFRVPANGTLNGRSDGESVKFSFTGDDDLWVYLSPVKDDGTVDYSKSQLALDLGGAHKEASGSINFKSMSSLVSQGSTIKTDNTVNEKTMMVQDSYNWGVNTLRIWAWKSGQTGHWYLPQSFAEGKAVFNADQTSGGVKLGDTDYFKVSQNEWQSQTKVDASIQGHFGKVTYTDNPEYTGTDLSNRWYNAASNKVTYLDRNKLGTTSTLDPTKMYHMTVFYMERGLIESNCSMEFTMTPAQNDYKVEKIINTAQLNAGIASQMANKDSFNFSTSGTYGNESVSRSAKLTHMQVKDYTNQFDTNTNLTTKETGAVLQGTNTASTTQYTTSWVVADTDAGQVVKDNTGRDAKGNGTSTTAFKLKRQDNSNDTIHLKSTFTNTPVTDNVTVSKKIVEENEQGQEVASKKIVTFNYIMKVDLDGAGSQYSSQAYPLDYLVGGHAAKMGRDGSFSFRSDQTVTVPNLPKNATFSIEEVKEAGFTPKQKVINGTVGQTATVSFTNVVTPSTDKIQGFKKLNNKLYTGDLFTFRLEGLPIPAGYTGGDIIDESHATFNPVTNITEGKIEFTLSYDSDDIGIHRYKFYEDTAALADMEIEEDFDISDSEWYVEVKVIKDGTDLKIDSMKYYKPVYKNPSAGVNSEIDVDATFSGTAYNQADFKNDVKPGSVTVYKSNNANERVNGIKFNLYKVSRKYAPIPTGATPYKTAETKKQLAKVYDDNGEVVMQTVAPGVTIEKKEEQDGIAKFEDLDIYKDMTCATFADDPYQWYCLEEVYEGDGADQEYNPNGKKVYFKIPMNGKYDYAARYVNGILKQPETSGDGMQIFKTVGLSLIGFAVLGFGAYLFYVRKPKRGTKRNIK